MRNKFLIISLAMSGLAAGQHEIPCDKKCAYEKEDRGYFRHQKDCNVTKVWNEEGFHHCVLKECKQRIKRCKPNRAWLCKRHTREVINDENFDFSRIDARYWNFYNDICD